MTPRRLLGALLACALLAAAGCGGSDKGGKGNAELAAGRPGGKITVVSARDVDYVDPGLTYYAFGSMLSTAVNRQLYTYGPGDTSTPTPDLAKEAPEISADRRTVTVKLRDDVRYSPPVGRKVVADDVKYAIERAFSRSVPNGYADFHFSSIEGAPGKAGAIRPIDGIQTPDDHTLVFRLKRPDGVRFAAALAMPITVPVPREYAAKFDRRLPSTYDDHVAFTGPYMIRNNAEGKLIGRQPGRSIDLVRNPNWDPKTDFRPAHVDEIRVEEGNTSATEASRRVLNGSGLVQGDTAPPAPVLAQALRRAPDQVATVPVPGFRMISMNTKIAPFDDLDVRRAVVAAMDRDALRRTRGGEPYGEVATHFLPPGFPGFEEGGGEKGPGLDFLAEPKGDMDLARQYLRKAGYASGRYVPKDPKERLLMVGTNLEPGRSAAEEARRQLEKLGFRLDFRIVPQDVLYERFCNRPAARVAICPNVGFFADYRDAESLLRPVFDGREILARENLNFSQLDDPQINAAMDAASRLAPGPERDKAWGRIDRLIAAQAPGVPWNWDKAPLVASKDVKAVPNAATKSYDLSFSSLKGTG